MNAEIDDSGGSGVSVVRPTGGNLLRHMMIAAVAVGTLLGTAEVYWSYLLPTVVAQWRGVLPTSFAGLTWFLLAAWATDILVMGTAGLVLWLALAAMRRAVRGGVSWQRTRFVATWLILGGGVSYLYVGWMTLFVIPASDSMDLAGLSLLGLGVVAALLVSLAVTGMLSVVRRRLKGPWVAAPWALAMAFELTLILPSLGNYRASERVESNPPVASGGGSPQHRSDHPGHATLRLSGLLRQRVDPDPGTGRPGPRWGVVRTGGCSSPDDRTVALLDHDREVSTGAPGLERQADEEGAADYRGGATGQRV